MTTAFVVENGLHGWRRMAWRALVPVRLYLRSFPFPRGKGLLMRALVLPVLPETGMFDVVVPGGAVIQFGYRERLGLGFLLRGEFERAEVVAAMDVTRDGTAAIDVGANVGLFATALTSRVGQSGHVFAVEPLAENVSRIRATAGHNGLRNLTAICCAAGSAPGTVTLHLAADSAFTSVDEPKEGGNGQGTRTVELCTLDAIWRQQGSPQVSFIKIDVEGMEAAVLAGASELLERCRPAMLLEANTAEQLAKLKGMLDGLGYRISQPPGFEKWNFMFRHGG